MEGEYLSGKENGEWNNYWDNGKFKEQGHF